MNQLRWRLTIIAVVTLWACYAVAPSVIYFMAPKEVRNSQEEMDKRIPKWLPQKHVSLGLDLQGGVQLVLGVNTDNAVDNKLARIGTEAQRWSDDNNIGIAKAYNVQGKQALRVEVKDGSDLADVREKFRKEFPGLAQSDKSDKSFDMQFEDDQIKRIKQSAIEQAEKVIRNRIDKWGVSEPVINRRAADNSILVQLPGFKDPERAKELLGRTAQLRFKLVDDKFSGFDAISKTPPAGITVNNNGGQVSFSGEDRDAILAFVKPALPEDRVVFFEREELAGAKARYTTYVVEAATEIGGDDVLDAFVTEDTTGLNRRPEVSMKFTGPGGKRFADVTGANVGRRLAIVLDDEVVSAPNIQTKISGGQARITLGTRGSFEQLYQEASQLALILKSGALPATIEVMEERQVGASLGPELADQGIRGVLIGLAAVIVYMVFFYHRPGVISCIALVLNGLLLMALMASLGFSLTLPGIAGFVLTLGMAVDANVLINERIRQELAEGKNAKKALENGFGRVFWTIFDSNITTLIAALVLLETNSSGPIRGFAVTLMVGIIVSMFTSLYCARSMFEFVTVRLTSDKAIRAWLGEKKLRHFSFDILKGSMPFTLIVGVLSVAVLGLTGVRGLNWGVDFAGGTELQVRFEGEVKSDEIRAVGKANGIGSMTLQALGEGEHQYLVRFGSEDFAATAAGGKLSSAEESEKVQGFIKSLRSSLEAKKPDVLSVDYVGPQIGKELRTQGVLSMFYAILGILAYIALRFDMRFAPGAVLKMLLDVFLVLGFYALFWRSVDLTTVAAFLTVIGYSINDAIVIFDRIRENMASNAKRSLRETINASLNETLTRSMNTSGTTLFSLFGILFFASGQIWNFAAAMAVGIVAATLTSTFVASAGVLWFKNFAIAKKKPTTGSSASTQPAPAR
jgi:protein-export membrane protein SecD/preprotein translocase SecF subunit